MKVEVDKFVVINNSYLYESASVKEFDTLEDAVNEYLRLDGPNDDDIYLLVKPKKLEIVISI